MKTVNGPVGNHFMAGFTKGFMNFGVTFHPPSPAGMGIENKLDFHCSLSFLCLSDKIHHSLFFKKLFILKIG
jgi:hypothetical protein